MTYSLTEKEEVLLEQKLEELFTLTELDPNEYIKEPALKKVRYKGKDVTKPQADWLKQADASDHWSDMYKGIREPSPVATGQIEIPTDTKPKPPDDDGKDDESDPFDVPEVPVLLPTIPKVKKPVPKPVSRPKPKLIPFTKRDPVPKPKPNRYVPKLPTRPIVTPVRPPVVKKPIVRKPPQLRPPKVRKPLTAPIRKPLQ